MNGGVGAWTGVLRGPGGQGIIRTDQLRGGLTGWTIFAYNVGYREQVRKTLLPQLSVIRENRSFINKSKLKKVDRLFNINLLILVLF